MGDTMEKETKTEVYYFDDFGRTVEPKKATKGIIREVDKDGNLVMETFGSFIQEPEYDDFDEYIASLEREEEKKGKQV